MTYSAFSSTALLLALVFSPASAQHSGMPGMPGTALPGAASPASRGSLPLTVKDARVVAVPPSIKETTLLITLTNTSAQAVVLSAVKSSVAGHVMLMKTVKSGALTGMQDAATLTVPARSSLKMNELGDHIMLMDLKRPLKVGETLSFTLVAKDGRTLTLKAAVKKPGS